MPVQVTEVLVDGLNVARSRWPNVAADELVERVAAWAAREGVRPVVVFDGEAPGGLVGERGLADGGLLIGTGRESADDHIADRAAALREAGRPYWLVTSDRELRSRAAGADRTIGGGAFVDLLELRGGRSARP